MIVVMPAARAVAISSGSAWGRVMMVSAPARFSAMGWSVIRRLTRGRPCPDTSRGGL